MECLEKVSDLRLGLSLASSGLSLISSLLVIFLIFTKGLFNTYSFKILIYISINDLIRSIIGFLEFINSENSTACGIYGYLGMYLFISNTLWALCLTFTIYQIIVLEDTSYEKWHKHWVLASVVVLGICSFPFITGSFGYDQGFCQIIEDEIGIIWRFCLVYFPSLLMFFGILGLYYKIFKKVKILQSVSLKGVVLDRGLVYAFIISIILIPYFVVRIVQVFYRSCGTEILEIFVNTFYFLEGLLNSFAFFYNKTVRDVVFRDRKRFKTQMETSFATLLVTFESEV